MRGTGWLSICKNTLKQSRKADNMEDNKPMGELRVDYRCAVCDKKVEVTAVANAPPIINRSCEHTDAIVKAWISGTLVRVKSTMEG